MKIKINFGKAQEITKVRLRREREPLLQALDIEYMQALEATDSVSTAKRREIATKKQALRDITKKADEATTLDELRAIKVEDALAPKSK